MIGPSFGSDDKLFDTCTTVRAVNGNDRAPFI